MVSKKGGFGECTLVPVFGTGEHPNVPSFWFLVLEDSEGNIRMYPRSGLWYRGTFEDTLIPGFGTGGTSESKTTLLEPTLSCEARKLGEKARTGKWRGVPPHRTCTMMKGPSLSESACCCLLYAFQLHIVCAKP